MSDSIDLFVQLSKRIPGVVYQFMVTRDGGWRFMYLSPAIEWVYEVPVQDALDNHQVLTSCIVSEDRESHRQSVERAIREKTDWAHLHRIRTPKGNLKWIHAQASADHLRDGSTLWHGVLSDVTWYMRKEAELVGLMQRFEASVETRWEYLSEDRAWLENYRRQMLSMNWRRPSSSGNGAFREPSRLDESESENSATTDIFAPPSEKLSEREESVLRMISCGLTSKEIAISLHIAGATVAVHRRNIKRKLQLKSSMAVTRYALLKFSFEASGP